MNISYLGQSLSTSMVLTGFAGSTAVNAHFGVEREALKVIRRDGRCYGDTWGDKTCEID